MNDKHIRFFALFFVLILILSCAENDKEKKRPNILFAIADDQSFAHTSFAGCKFIQTPAFDRVASEGVYFTIALLVRRVVLLREVRL